MNQTGGSVDRAVGSVQQDLAAQRRGQIMQAVIDVTAAGGLAAVTFRSVAEHAGVSVRLVQYYFGDKRRLLADTLTYVQLEIADIVAQGMAALGHDPSAQQMLEVLVEAFVPADERRHRAMLVFHAFGAAALTDESLQGPGALRRGRDLADAIAAQLARVRDDDHVPDDALLLVSAISGLGNGVLAGDLTVDECRRLQARALSQALHPSNPSNGTASTR